MDKKRLLLVCCPLYLLFYMGDAFLTSYYSLYFASRGMDGTEMAILLGAIPFSLFVGCFALSPLAKTPKRSFWLYRICAVIEAGLAVAFAFCDGFASLLIVTILVAFFNSAPFSFLEGYVAPLSKKAGTAYSNIRLWGTLGYIVSLVIGYFLLNKLPIGDSYYFASGLFLFAFAVSFLVPTSRYADRDEGEIVEKHPLFNMGFVFFLLFNLFMYGAFHSMIYVLPLRLSGLGMSDAEYSLTRGIGIVGELVAMILFPFLHKLFGNKKVALLCCAGFLFVGSMLGIFISNPYALGYASLTITGIGKAFYFAFASFYIIDLVGEKNLPIALTLSSGVANMAATLLNLASTSVYGAWGFEGYFGLATGLEAIGILFLLLSRPQREETAAA